MSKQKRRTLRERLAAPTHLWGRLATTLIPVAVIGVWLKLIRIDRFYPGSDLMGTLTKVSSDVAFGAAWILLWFVLCVFSRGWLRAVLFYLAHIASCVVGVYIVVNHEFGLRTGNPLTWDTMVYAFTQGDQLAGLVGSEMTDSAIALLWTIIASTLALPLLVGRLIDPLLRWRPRKGVKRAAVLALVALLFGSSWTAPTASAAFALAAPVRLAVSPVRDAFAYPSVSDAWPTDPGETTLTPRDGAQHRNLVLITLESQRATSTLPETRQPVTPVLDALAADSITPRRGYSVFPHTSKALTAVTCGIVPPADAANSEAEPTDGIPAACLPALLGEQGYASKFFQTATEHFERRRGTVANFGYDEFMPVDEMSTVGFHRANYFGYEEDIMLEPQREWLEQQEGPFMLGMLTVTGHHDYKLEGYEEIDFVDDPLLNKYLNSIHYQDAFVGRLIDMFKELGLYEDTVFIITGDHGEGFGEHRVYQHDNTIYEEGIRIPYLIHDPLREGQVLDDPTDQLAILPTAVDLLGFDLVGAEGYRPSLLSGEEQPPVVATCYARARCMATIDGDMKVIQHFGDRRDEVFDLSTDNYERVDLADQYDEAWRNRHSEFATKWYVAAENFYEAAREQ